MRQHLKKINFPTCSFNAHPVSHKKGIKPRNFFSKIQQSNMIVKWIKKVRKREFFHIRAHVWRIERSKQGKEGAENGWKTTPNISPRLKPLHVPMQNLRPFYCDLDGNMKNCMRQQCHCVELWILDRPLTHMARIPLHNHITNNRVDTPPMVTRSKGIWTWSQSIMPPVSAQSGHILTPMKQYPQIYYTQMGPLLAILHCKP